MIYAVYVNGKAVGTSESIVTARAIGAKALKKTRKTQFAYIKNLDSFKKVGEVFYNARTSFLYFDAVKNKSYDMKVNGTLSKEAVF